MPRDNQDLPDQQPTFIDRRRRLPFVMLQSTILRTAKLTHTAKLLYLLLIDYAGQGETCFPKQETLARDLADPKKPTFSLDKVQDCLNELRLVKLLDWSRPNRNRPNVYSLLPVEESVITAAGYSRSNSTPEPPTRSDTAGERSPDTAGGRSPLYEQDPRNQTLEKKQQQNTAVSAPTVGGDAEIGECDVVVARLVSNGVKPKAARLLVADPQIDQAVIVRQLDHHDFLKETGKLARMENPPGRLVEAIKGDWDLSAGYLQRQEQQAKRRQRQEQQTHQAEEQARQAEEELLRQVADLARDPHQAARLELARYEERRARANQRPLGDAQRTAKLEQYLATRLQRRQELLEIHPEFADQFKPSNGVDLQTTGEAENAVSDGQNGLDIVAGSAVDRSIPAEKSPAYLSSKQPTSVAEILKGRHAGPIHRT